MNKVLRVKDIITGEKEYGCYKLASGYYGQVITKNTGYVVVDEYGCILNHTESKKRAMELA